LRAPAGFSPALIAILLHSGRAKPGQPETVDGMLPGEELLHRQRITAASLVQAEQAATHRGDDFGLAPNDPASRRGRRKIGERQRAPIGADDIAHTSFALFHHYATPKPRLKAKIAPAPLKKR